VEVIGREGVLLSHQQDCSVRAVQKGHCVQTQLSEQQIIQTQLSEQQMMQTQLSEKQMIQTQLSEQQMICLTRISLSSCKL